MHALQASIALVGRLFLAAIFVLEGWLKVKDPGGTASYMTAHGVAAGLLPLVILTELGGGVLVAAGLLTRFAALALAGFCLLAALFFHRDFAEPGQTVHFLKNLAIAGGFLALVAFGPGAWSLDHWRRRTTKD
jgi:putative oxidoreductase